MYTRPVSERHRFALRPVRPYSLAQTAARFVRFPEVVDCFEDGTYRRLLPVGRRLLLVAVRQAAPPSRALLEVRIQGRDASRADARDAARRLVARALGARAPLAAFRRRFRDDPLLRDALVSSGGLSVAGCPEAWEALITAVFSQQVNLALAYRIRRDFALAYGRRARFADRTWIAFPRPERIARESRARLRRLGLSGAKAETVLRLARAFRDGELDEDRLDALDDAAVIEQLTAIKGVGRWTAETTLIRGLARPDVFPAGDLGVVKYVAQGLLGHDGRAREADMREFSERWRPYRSLALIYAYAELRRQQELQEPPT